MNSKGTERSQFAAYLIYVEQAEFILGNLLLRRFSQTKSE